MAPPFGFVCLLLTLVLLISSISLICLPLFAFLSFSFVLSVSRSCVAPAWCEVSHIVSRFSDVVMDLVRADGRVADGYFRDVECNFATVDVGVIATVRRYGAGWDSSVDSVTVVSVLEMCKTSDW